MRPARSDLFVPGDRRGRLLVPGDRRGRRVDKPVIERARRLVRRAG